MCTELEAERLARFERRKEAEKALAEMTSKQRLDACREFVHAVLDRNDDIEIFFYPVWLEPEKDERIRVTFYYGQTDHTKPDSEYGSCDFQTDELVKVLEPLGKVHRWQDKRPWDIVFRYPESHQPPQVEIIASRLKLARETLGMDLETFYKPARMTTRTALNWEYGKIAQRFLALGERRFKALSEAHKIPEWWLLFLDRFVTAESEKKRAA